MPPSISTVPFAISSPVAGQHGGAHQCDALGGRRMVGAGIGIAVDRGLRVGDGRRRRLRPPGRGAARERGGREEDERGVPHLASGVTERITPPLSSRKSIDALPSG